MSRSTFPCKPNCCGSQTRAPNANQDTTYERIRFTFSIARKESERDMTWELLNLRTLL